MDPPECPICYVPITRRLTFVDCKHQICLTCGVRWLYKKSLCPICRIPSSTLLVSDFRSVSKPKRPILTAQVSLEKDLKKPQTQSFPKSKQNPSNKSTQSVQPKQTISKSKQREMSLPELISTYWEDIKFEVDSCKINKSEEVKDQMEDIDISVFRNDLQDVMKLTSKVEVSLSEFDHHIFYSEYLDVLADIKRTNEYYHQGVNERDPSISKYHFACFVEFVFKFLNELESSLKDRDMDLIRYLLSVVDEVYYNSYMEYYFRGYEGSDDEC